MKEFFQVFRIRNESCFDDIKLGRKDTEKQTKSLFVNQFLHCDVINYWPHRKYAVVLSRPGVLLIVSR